MMFAGAYVSQKWELYWHPCSAVKNLKRFMFFNWYSGGWSPIGSTRHCGHQWPIVPAPSDYDDGEIGGMIGRGNRSTRRKTAPEPLYPPQIPHALRTRTRAAPVGSQRLTAWTTARPTIHADTMCCFDNVILSLVYGYTTYNVLIHFVLFCMLNIQFPELI
jgi:hypothetical protein